MRNGDYPEGAERVDERKGVSRRSVLGLLGLGAMAAGGGILASRQSGSAEAVSSKKQRSAETAETLGADELTYFEGVCRQVAAQGAIEAPVEADADAEQIAQDMKRGLRAACEAGGVKVYSFEIGGAKTLALLPPNVDLYELYDDRLDDESLKMMITLDLAYCVREAIAVRQSAEGDALQNEKIAERITENCRRSAKARLGSVEAKRRIVESKAEAARARESAAAAERRIEERTEGIIRRIKEEGL